MKDINEAIEKLRKYLINEHDKQDEIKNDDFDTKKEQYNRPSKMCLLVANRIINRTNANNLFRRDCGMNHIQLNGIRLQKVLYLCYLYNLIINKNELFSDDFEAWFKGPVVSNIYNVFSVTGRDLLPVPMSNSDDKLKNEQVDLINYVVDSTIDLSLNDLIDFSRISNGPWKIVFNDNSDSQLFPIIENKLLKEYARNNEKEIIDFIEHGINPICEKKNVKVKNYMK